MSIELRDPDDIVIPTAPEWEAMKKSNKRLLSENAQLRAELAASQAREGNMLEILEEFYDDSECQLDHHGYCQAHGLRHGPSNDKACVMERIAALMLGKAISTRI